MTRGIVAAALAALCSLSMGGCQDGYPIEATHCDHFCHALERSTCGQDPVHCVLACEEEGSTIAPVGCDREVDALLACLSQLPAEQLPCSTGSFYRCATPAALLQVCRTGPPSTS